MSSFWQTYNFFSLKTPWIVQAETASADPSVNISGEVSKAEVDEPQSGVFLEKSTASAPLQISTDKPMVFVLGCAKGSADIETMVSKMISAIGQNPETVFCHWGHEMLRASSFSKLSSKQKIFVFGKKNIYGQTNRNHGTWFPLGKSGLQAMVTFDLGDLKVNSKLKRQTWEHLKAYAGISS